MGRDIQIHLWSPMLNQLLEDVASRGLAEPGCDKAPEGHICDNGQLFSESLRRVVGQCACYPERAAAELKRWKSQQINVLKGLLLPRIDLTKTNTESKKWYKKLPESGGVWMHGVTGEGKSHAAGWLLAKRIKESKRKFSWSWYSIREIMAAWSEQYSEDTRVKREAWAVMGRLEWDDMIVIDDADKTGAFTKAREEHFYDFINTAHAKCKELIFTANIGIAEFCDKMDDERAKARRDGVGPIQRRIREMCKEVQT